MIEEWLNTECPSMPMDATGIFHLSGGHSEDVSDERCLRIVIVLEKETICGESTKGMYLHTWIKDHYIPNPLEIQKCRKCWPSEFLDWCEQKGDNGGLMSDSFILRLGIPGKACVHCDTIITKDSLKCSGCGWVDPLTKSLPRFVQAGTND